MELKLDSSPEEALDRIDSKEYVCQFEFDDKKIFKIGISYSSGTKNISDWKIVS